MPSSILQGVESGVEYPSLSDRVQSTFIDTIFIVILMFVFSSFLDDEAPTWLRVILFFGLWALYEPLCTSMGFTIGNYAKGLRVRRSSNETRKVNFFRAFVRYLVKISLGWISFITINMN